MGKFVVSLIEDGRLKFDLKAGNGEIIASSQGYTAYSSCRNGIASVRRNARTAAIEDQTLPDYDVLKCPKFEVFEDGAGGFQFRLKAKNGQVVVTGQSYKSKSGCLGGIDALRKNAPDAPTVDADYE